MSTAILARTHRALREPEAALSSAGIPYHLVGRSGFWAAEENKAAINYLSACLFPANHVLAGILRTSFHPTKFLPRTKILARLKEFREKDDSVSYWKLMTQEPLSLVEGKNLEALRSFVSFVHALSRYRDLAAGDALKQVLSSLRAFEYYGEFEDTPDSNPTENLIDLCKIAGRFPSIKEFLEYTRKVTAASKKKSGVALATVHSAKGLEWNTVYFVGVSEGILPHAKSDDLAGEANVWFVGCSRAERELVISYSGAPSPFLKEFLDKSKQPVVQCKEEETI
jgi:DNA helicase-2/ATP-dependent DNA helicase PcrA